MPKPLYSVPPVIYDNLHAYCVDEVLDGQMFENVRKVLGWLAAQDNPAGVVALLAMPEDAVPPELVRNRAKTLAKIAKLDCSYYVSTSFVGWSYRGLGRTRAVWGRNYEQANDVALKHALAFNAQASVKVEDYRCLHAPKPYVRHWPEQKAG